MKPTRSAIEQGYDDVAEEYAVEFADELDKKPFDREILDQFAERLAGKGLVYEVGCGPGHITQYLKDRGIDIVGTDISQGMVNEAARLHPEISFQRCDMLALNTPDSSLTGVVGFYSIVHIERDHIVDALREFHRVMKPGGLLLLSFHAGTGVLQREEWYRKKVAVTWTLVEAEEMSRYLNMAGFEVERQEIRKPYGFEHPTDRIYVTANRP